MLLLLFFTMFSSVSCETVFTFTFQDTFRDGMSMARHLEEYGWKGTFYINGLRLCLHPDYLNRDDVNQLFLKGHDIGGHGLSHAKSFELNPTQLEIQLCCDRGLLQAYRWSPTTIAYPHGQYNETIRNMVEYCGYCNALHVGGIRSTDTCVDCPNAETLPPSDKWKIKSYSVRGTDTLQDLIGRVQRAIDDTSIQRKWVVFNFHKLCDSQDVKCTSYAHYVLRNVFLSFAQYLRGEVSSGKLQVLNVKDVMQSDCSDVPVPKNAIIPFDDLIELVSPPHSSNAVTLSTSSAFLILIFLSFF